MSFAATAAEYFTYEARLSSFQTAQPLGKRRASNANSKASKSLKWPHKFLPAQDLAKAGFYYHPSTANPDNVVCFLCHKGMDGWEEGDDPLAEHLKHSPNCGWAIVASIEAQDGELSQEYPLSIEMIEARRATFADRWPHESKKGWKCKTKQLVDAGWKYTPSPEYDDMATCAYCSLALDGWEPGDKPMDEHHKRSPDCAFFTLVNDHKQASKASKSKRTSKASRISTQSSITQAEDFSTIDLPAEEGDSVLTTATTATGRKMAKGKKAAPAKTRKTKTKKDEPAEVQPALEPEDDDFEVKVEVPSKPTRGKKRKSEEIQEATSEAIVEAEAPAPKRRATRARASVAMNESVMVEEPTATTKPKGRKGRVSKAKKSSLAPMAQDDPVIPDDDEIDRALEADLERQMSVDENVAPLPKKKTTRGCKAVKPEHEMFGVNEIQIEEAEIEAELDAMEAAAASKPLPKPKGAKGKATRKPSAKQQAAARKVAEEEAAKAAAELEAQRSAEQDASEQILADLEQSVSVHHSSPVLKPKKQRATTKNASKQTTAKKVRASVVSIQEDESAMPGAFVDDEEVQSGNETDASMASQSTVVRGGTARRGSTIGKGKQIGKNTAPKKLEEIIQRAPLSEIPVEAQSEKTRKGKKVLRSEDIGMMEDFYTPAPEVPMESIEHPDEMDVIDLELEEPDFESTPARSPARPQIQQTLTAMVENMEKTHAPSSSRSKQTNMASPAPRPAPRVPTPPPREPTASQSPQSSDAENHPPSSRPSLGKKTPTPLAAPHFHTSTPRTATVRMPLADATRTPLLSPSKRMNTISGLQSAAAWTAVDLEAIFVDSSSGEENELETALSKAKQGELTSPEKKMTVEEWILYNAGVAEEMLKRECERMVSVFEREGGRAMRALEGIEALE